MKSFACGDVVPGCEARWVCSTEDEFWSMWQPTPSAHGLEALPADVVQSIHKAVVSVS